MTLADTIAVALIADRRPATIRDWARKGLITRHGTDVKGRALYDLHEVQHVDRRLRRAA